MVGRGRYWKSQNDCPFAVLTPIAPSAPTLDLAMDYEDWASNLFFCSKLSSHTSQIAFA